MHHLLGQSFSLLAEKTYNDFAPDGKNENKEFFVFLKKKRNEKKRKEKKKGINKKINN